MGATLKPDCYSDGERRSAWAAGPLPAADWPSLQSAEQSEIAIVGGGVAGASAALNLALLGHRPILIERDRIGAGAAGASGGIVAPQLARHGFADVEQRLGRPHAEQLFRLVAQSGQYLFDLARAHVPDCEAEQNGFIAPAASAAGLRRIAQTVAGWSAFRSDVSLLDAEGVAALSGVRGYAGALLDGSGGAINPLRFVRGLAAAAAAEGARVFCDSAVTRMEQAGSDWLLTTASGSIRARHVLLCGNGGNTALHPALAGTVLPMDVCEVTTAPIPDALRRRVLPGRHVMTDVEDDVFTIRYDRDGGLVTAYPGTGSHPARTAELVNSRLAAAIEGWRPLPLTHIWHGTAWINTSLAPRLVQVAPGVTAVQACNGRGLAFNAIIGRELARWLAGPAGTAPPLPFETPNRIAGLFLARHAPQIVMRAGLIRKRLRHLVGRSK